MKTTLIKNYRRNRLLTERLDTLIAISAEKTPLEEFPFGRALMKWKTDKSGIIFAKPVVKWE